MDKAHYVFIRVVFVITCVDLILWIGGCYWRSAGETVMKSAAAIERNRSFTERALASVARAVNAYIREKRKIPKRISEVTKDGTVPTDAWDHRLRLEKTEEGVRVVSAGPDGDFVTEDDNMYSEPQNGAR